MLVGAIATIGAGSATGSGTTVLGLEPRLTVADPLLGDPAGGADAGVAGSDGRPLPSPVDMSRLALIPDGATDDVAFAPRYGAILSPSPVPTRAGPAAVHAPAPGKPASPPFAPLLWPVPGGQLSQGFGCTGVVWEPPVGRCAHYHNGIDIAAPQGTPVVAAARGTVVFAGWQDNGGGYQVWVSDGGGMYTGYHHLAAISVFSGEAIRRGQRVGAVGMTGDATGPHLHLVVSIGPFWSTGQPVDPRRYM